MKQVLKVVFVIIGALIGAGFASGQEIYVFFFSYGLKGVFGLLCSNLLMGVVIYKSLNLIKKYQIQNYEEFLDAIFPSKKVKNKSQMSVKKMINYVITIFIVITFFIMIAGFGAYLEQELGIKSIIGSAILSLLCFCIFQKSTNGVMKASEIIIPVLICFVTIIGILNIKQIHWAEIHHYVIQTNFTNWLVSAILYCSYNSILLIPVLITLKEEIKQPKQISVIAIITTNIAIVLSILIYFILVRVDVPIQNLEMPAVYVVANAFPKLRILYGFILAGAIFTTAISLGNSFLQNVSKTKKSYQQKAVIMCITSIIVSQFGFSNLVNLLYPIFGYLGLIQIFKINLAKIRKN